MITKIILVIEDNELNMKLVRSLLQIEPAEYEIATPIYTAYGEH